MTGPQKYTSASENLDSKNNIRQNINYSDVSFDSWLDA